MSSVNHTQKIIDNHYVLSFSFSCVTQIFLRIKPYLGLLDSEQVTTNLTGT